MKQLLKLKQIYSTYIFTDIQNKSKVDARCEHRIYIECDEESSAYFVYFPEIIE